MKKVTVSPLEVVKLSTGLNWYCFYASSHIPNDFVCLFLFVWSLLSHSRNFSIIWRRHHCRWRAANFDLCSALMAIEQWGFFNVPYLLWHGPTVYNGHLRGPVSLTPVAERLGVKLSLPVCTSQVCRDRGSNPELPHARRTLYLYATAAVQMLRKNRGRCPAGKQSKMRKYYNNTSQVTSYT